jgi:Flp pilus assembly protein TadD
MATLLSTDKALTYARKAEKTGDWSTAYDLYKGVLDRFPANKRAKAGLKDMKPKAVQGLLQDAKAAQSKQNWSKSEDHMALAFDLAPELAEIGIALASLRMQVGNAPGALETANRILEHQPDHVEATNIKGKALREMGRAEDAHEAYSAALATQSEDALTFTNLGSLARANGDKVKEREYAEKALALSPHDGAMHWNLARTQTYSEDTPHLADMLALLSKSDTNAATTAPLRMALFKAYDDIGHRDTAFAHLQEGNRLTKSAIDYDFQKDAVSYALSKNLISQALPTPRPAEGPRPIFVTGLPRTGTTLTERILAQDPEARACGELSVVNRCVSRLLQDLMSGRKPGLGQDDILKLRQDILSGLADYAEGSAIIIDKMPLNFRWIGFVCAAIPEARVIHMNRDPMAVAWSHYRHSFTGAGNGFVYSFDGIAQFMVLHRDWMNHWRKVCPGYILDVDYAKLVGDTEAETRRLAEFTGLEWSENWLSPERSESQVLTASATQVRKPIYGGSDAGWKKYEPHLAPLKGALKSAGIL